MKRGAYFFVLDAFIAGIIIISSLGVLFTTISFQDNPVPNYLLAEDFMDFLDTTTLSSYSGESAFVMFRSGDISDRSLTLLEQVVVFKQDVADKSKNITSLLKEVSRLAPDNGGIGYYYTDGGSPQPLYINDSRVAENDARLHLSSQRIISVAGDPPVVVEVRLWR